MGKVSTRVTLKEGNLGSVFIEQLQLKAIRAVLEKEEINSSWEIKTYLCLMLIDFKRKNKIKESPVSVYLICLGGL